MTLGRIPSIVFKASVVWVMQNLPLERFGGAISCLPPSPPLEVVLSGLKSFLLALSARIVCVPRQSLSDGAFNVPED